MKPEEKREVPSTLRKILAVDAYLTNAFVNWADQFLFLRQLKTHHKFLEISCHSIAWLATNLMFIWIFNNSHLYQMQVNLLIGLVLDIVLIAILKAITRRRRPTANDGTVSHNKDSFPSGHVSRATFIMYFFLNLWPLPLICMPPLLAWCFSVSMSRLLMKRHHVLDVSAGIVLGVFQGLLVGYMYLDEKTCTSLIWWLTDEKISGAEYDV